jgi:hypothetical protein
MRKNARKIANVAPRKPFHYSAFEAKPAIASVLTLKASRFERTGFRFDLNAKSRCRMIEPTTLKFLNERIAELTKQYETRENRALLEELSELTIMTLGSVCVKTC